MRLTLYNTRVTTERDLSLVLVFEAFSSFPHFFIQISKYNSLLWILDPNIREEAAAYAEEIESRSPHITLVLIRTLVDREVVFQGLFYWINPILYLGCRVSR